MMRSLLCAAALVVLGASALGERIDPMSLDVVHDVHSDRVRVTLVLSRPPDLLTDRISVNGYNNVEFPERQEFFGIDNYWPPQDGFRITSGVFYETRAGDLEFDRLLDWTALDCDIVGPQLSCSFPSSDLGWQGVVTEAFAESRDEPSGSGESIVGRVSVAAPEPSSIVMASTPALLLAFWVLTKRRRQASRCRR